MTVVACAGLAAASSSALAGGNNVGFGFTANTMTPGFETLTVTWSSDPGATFVITPAGPGTGWDISLVGSGHSTSGGDFLGEAGMTMTWADPINAGMFSNLTFIDSTTWHLEILSPVPANTYNAGFGVFANGVSIYAGFSGNEFAYAAVSIVPAPGAAAALGLGGLAAMRRRRR